MSTAFKVLVTIMVPLSGMFLLLLLLPFPPRARKFINNILTKIFLLPGPFGLSTITTVLAILFLMFAHVSYDLYSYSVHFSMEGAKQEPPKVSVSEHRLMRIQRNFWVGLLLVVFWTVLSMLLKLSKRLVEQEAELALFRTQADEAKKRAPTPTSTTKSTTPTPSTKDTSGVSDKLKEVSESVAESVDVGVSGAGERQGLTQRKNQNRKADTN